MKCYVVITRMVKETGRATIDVPDGVDKEDYLEELRENGDDFLKWESDDISDLIISIEEIT